MTEETPTNDELQARAESHRAFVREVDREMGVVYGYGGGGVLLAAGGIIALGWYTQLLGGIATAMITLTTVLIGLYVVRRIVNARKPRLLKRVDDYCDANGLSPELLREYYARDNMYPYFIAVFETTTRDALSENPGS